VISLKPLSNDLCQCPRCGSNLTGGDVLITGMRNLLDASCEPCRASYYADLPSGHAIFSPVAIDKYTGEVFDPTNARWFSAILVRSVKDKQPEPVSIAFHRTQRHPKIVLLNCLDYLYGHCLLKLLNAQYYIDHRPEVACCVLVPKQLIHLVPDGVAEVWEVDLPLKNFRNWYISLEQQIRAEIDARETCYLSVAHSHPHASRYDLNRFTKVSPKPTKGIDSSPVIVYVYREDRLWGVSLTHQTKNISNLYERLRLAFPTLTFIVAGFGDGGAFTQGIVDERSTCFSLEQEQRWLELYASADCVVGVHGSNMLLPSGLAAHVVELLPEDRLGNITQDLLWPDTYTTGNEALYRVRFLVGRTDLHDVRSNLVASVVIHQLAAEQTFTSAATASLLPVDDRTGIFDTGPLVQRASEDRLTQLRIVRGYRSRLLQHPLTRLGFQMYQLKMLMGSAMKRELLSLAVNVCMATPRWYSIEKSIKRLRAPKGSRSL